jgi:hypothetical protein
VLIPIEQRQIRLTEQPCLNAQITKGDCKPFRLQTTDQQLLYDPLVKDLYKCIHIIEEALAAGSLLIGSILRSDDL